MNTIKMLNEALETKYHLNEAKEDKEKFLSFINATIKDNIKSQSIVDNFDKLKSSGRIKGEEADYYYWIKNKTVDELQDFLDTFNSTLSKTQTKKQEKAGAEPIPCSNPDWVIYKITTYDASKYYGEHTHWCITGRNGPDGIGAFNHYKKNGVKDYYFLWKIGNEKNGKWCYLDYGKELKLNNQYFYDAQDKKHMMYDDVDIPYDVLLCLPGISQDIIDVLQDRKERTMEFQKTGVYIYNPLDDDFLSETHFIQGLNPKKIIVPDSVEGIEYSAFSHCGSLKDVILSNNVKYIDSCAFYLCTSLQEITLPNSVKEIGNSAFRECVSLKEIHLFNNIEKIGGAAFQDCTSLQEITIPNKVKKIEGGVFDGCTSLQDVTIPNSVTQIGDCAFSCCYSLKEITIPDSVEKIGDYVFSNCVSLQEVCIPNNVKEIGHDAFCYCTSLQEILLPDSVEKIGEGAFYNCTSLKEINIEGEYRPKIFKNALLRSDMILNWVDAGIKETVAEVKGTV